MAPAGDGKIPHPFACSELFPDRLRELLGAALRVAAGRPVEMELVPGTPRNDVEMHVRHELVGDAAIVLKHVDALAAGDGLDGLDQGRQVRRSTPRQRFLLPMPRLASIIAQVSYRMVRMRIRRPVERMANGQGRCDRGRQQRRPAGACWPVARPVSSATSTLCWRSGW